MLKDYAKKKQADLRRQQSAFAAEGVADRLATESSYYIVNSPRTSVSKGEE